MNTFAFVFLIFLCRKEVVGVVEGVSYKWQRTSCNTFNSKFIYNASCRVRHVNRTTQIINSEVNIQPNVSIGNVRIDFTTYLKFGAVFRPSLIHHSEFICEALNKGLFSHLVNALEPSYSKFSNLFEPCPRSGKIYVKNMIVDISPFPQFLPVGEYRVDIKTSTFMNGIEEFVMLNQEYVEIKPLGAEQF